MPTASGDGTLGGRDFGAYRAASIAGETFEDLNADGDRDAGEPTIAGRTIYVDADASGDLSAGDPTTTSGAGGAWSFSLDPGSYTIREVLPNATWHCSLPGAGCAHAVTLLSGDDVTARDFGSWQEVTIGGTKYEDLNADGDRDAGEPALGGKTIKLDPATPGDASDDTSVVTAGDGSYSFAGLTPGVDYRVYDEGESGWTCSEPGSACEYTVPTESGDGTLGGRDFGAWRAASVAGETFEDLNADGDRDAGEPAIAGRTIYVDADASGDLSAGDPTTTSGAGGAWSFSLDPGAYTIREELPSSNWHCSLPGAGCAHAVTLASGGDVTGRDFGSWREVAIAGTKYGDLNADGDRDGGEPPLDGRDIKLDPGTPGDASDDLTATTASDGSYSFAGLTPGVTYRVHDEGETGWVCSEPGAPCEYAVPTASGDGTITRDFGAWRAASVSGETFEDLDADGVRDAGEPAIAGRTIYVDADASGDLSASDPTTTSGAGGAWSFTLDPGAYTIREELPNATWHCSLPGAGCAHAVTLASGDDVTGRDFGSWREVTIAGTKYDDLNADGDRDPGEPGLDGKTIKLDPGTPGDASDDRKATTGADGGYSFPGLTPGTDYRVYDEGESGWTCSQPGSPCEYAVPTASGDGTITRDFGVWRPAELEVRQLLDPANDPGRFDLSIGGKVEKALAGHDDRTGRRSLTPGAHAVTSGASAGTDGSKYDTTLECRANRGAGAVVPSPDGNVTLAGGDDVLCTFTSVRKPEKEIEQETEAACLKRPVLTWVKGTGIKRVVFYLDGKRRSTVTRPDAEGRYSLRTDRRTLSPGKHEVRARVFFKRAGRAPKTLRFQIQPCLKLEPSTKIETEKKGELDVCASRTFRAFVRGDTIRRVIFYLNGKKVKSTKVADWRGRYWVSVRPSALSIGRRHELSARMYFIKSGKQRSRVLTLSFRRCGS